ncbi:hypothetical protein Tco_0024317 [Tanacetum coccineum]
MLFLRLGKIPVPLIQVLRGISSTKQVNSIQQLIEYCLTTRTKVDIGEIIYSDLVTRLTNKSRQKYVSYRRFVLCALEVLLVIEYTQDKNFKSLSNVLSNSNFTKDPSKVTLIELMASMIAINNLESLVETPPTKKVPTEDSDKTKSVSSGQTAHPQDIERNTQLVVKGSHYPPDEGTRKSQPLPEGKTTDPKDSKGNKHPADKGLPFTVPDDCIGKTKPLPERSREDKDSERLKPLADMESLTSPVTVLLGTDAKYQNFKPLKLTTIADIQALLRASDDDLKEDSEDDVFKAGEEMDEYIQEADTEEHQTHLSTETPTKEPYKSISLHHQAGINLNPPKLRRLMHQTQSPHHVLKLSSLMTTICQSLKGNSFTKYENTDAALKNFQQILNLFKTDHNTRLRRILTNLKEVEDAVKEDPALNNKVLEATEAYTENSTNVSEPLTPVKTFDFSGLKSIVESLKATMDSQNDHLATWAKSSTNLAWSVGPRLTKIVRNTKSIGNF